MEQERQEQEERERRYREREQQIEEHRSALPHPRPHAPGLWWTHPKVCMLAYRSRRKQQTLEAEEAKRRLKEQSIFVSF